VATPYDAIFDGASYLVVGRPIRKADAPVAACDKIATDIERAEADREKAIREAS
jgi:orotidine-5'-phosphate decarboxylase